MRRWILVILLWAAPAGAVTVMQSSFAGGEISPLAHARIDAERYYQSAQSIQNMIVLPQGPAIRRPGTEFVALADPGRLIGYEGPDPYMLWFGHRRLRFFHNGSAVVDANDLAYEIETPFDGNDLDAIQTWQSDKAMYIVDGKRLPQKLVRHDSAHWVIEPAAITTGPFLSRDPDDTTLGFEGDTEHSYFAVSATQVDVVEMPMAADAYLSKDFGAAHFESFEIRFRFYAGWISHAFTSNNLVALANMVGTQHQFEDESEKFVVLDYYRSGVVGGDKVFLDLDAWFSTSGTTLIEIQQYRWHYVILSCNFSGGANSQGLYILQTSQGDYYDQAGATNKQSRTYDVPSGGQTAYRYLHSPQSKGDPWGSSVPVRTTYSVADLTVDSVAQDFTTFDRNDGGGAVVLTASQPIFQEGHLGSLWQLGNRRAERVVISGLGGNASTGYLPVGRGAGVFVTTTGTFNATISIERSYDDSATWTALATNDKENFDEWGAIEDGHNARYRVTMTDYVSGSCTVKLRVTAHMAYGIVQLTEILSETTAQAIVRVSLPSADPTRYWAEGAWSGVRGFPAAITSYADRLLLASTAHQPVTIWGSRTGKYEDFAAGTLADDSFAYTLVRSTADPILWMLTQRRKGLILGTGRDVVELEPLGGSSIGPADPPAIAHTVALPCAPVRPIEADNVLLVLQRHNRKIREILYHYESDSLLAPDLTIFADHVTGGGVRQMAWTHQPYAVLWATRTDGGMIGCTYDRHYQTVGWHQHNVGGDVVSLASIPGRTQDDLWLLVRRSVDPDTRTYTVERMREWDYGRSESAYFLDGGRTYAGAESVPVWSIARWWDPQVPPGFPPGHPGQFYYVTVHLTEVVESLEDGDTVTLSGVVGAPWMNGVWPITGVRHDLVYYPGGEPVLGTWFELVDSNDPNAGRFDVYGLPFDSSLLPPTLPGAAVGVEASDEFGGLDHLIGFPITVIADGQPVYDVVVDPNGDFTLDEPAWLVHAGLPYRSAVRTIRYDFNTDQGPTWARRKSIPQAMLNVFETSGVQFGRDLDQLVTPDWGDELYTGDQLMMLPSRFDTEASLWIVTDQPFPATLRAIVLELEMR